MPVTYTSTASSGCTSSTSNYIYGGTIASSASTTGTMTTVGRSGNVQLVYDAETSWNSIDAPPYLLEEGKEYKLPDGSILKIDDNGNFVIEDEDANVTYKANNIREFNKFINASDLLELFIKDCGRFGAKQNQILDIPIELFINWLIIKSAESDGDLPPVIPKLEYNIKKTPHCKWCGKFISKKGCENGINFCGPDCMIKMQNKIMEI